MECDYKTKILTLNYCLYSSLTSTVLLRDDCTIALNPLNPAHQQSNLCYRIRLRDVDQFAQFIKETSALFNNVSCQPRYFIDAQAEPSFEKVVHWFRSYGYDAEVDADLIMSWQQPPTAELSLKDLKSKLQKDGLTCSLAREEQLDSLTDVFAAAFGYGDDISWLRYKIKTQLSQPDLFAIYVLETCHDEAIVSAVILHTPPGLPDMGHVNVIATHPSYQRKGYGALCLEYALLEHDKNRTYFLEVYDDLYHAHRMYKQVGFKSDGLIHSSTVVLNDNKQR